MRKKVYCECSKCMVRGWIEVDDEKLWVCPICKTRDFLNHEQKEKDNENKNNDN